MLLHVIYYNLNVEYILTIHVLDGTLKWDLYFIRGGRSSYLFQRKESDIWQNLIGSIKS